MKMNIKAIAIVTAVMIYFISAAGFAEVKVGKAQVSVRIKDLAYIQGNNTNQLIGYGLVTGLRGTGDRTKTVANAMIQNMFNGMGMKLDPSELQRLTAKNTAVVMVTANLPASFRSGDTLDVTVSSMGDASSLESGVLMFSTLRGPDGSVYASAQGPLTVGLEGVDTRGRKNTRTLVGIIPDGAIICRNMDANLVREGKMTWVLRNPDFNTASRMVKVINEKFHRTIASANGDRFVVVDMDGVESDVALVAATIGDLKVTPDSAARVVVNERTGTIVMGSEVKILPVIISHKNLTLNVGDGTGEGKKSVKTGAAGATATGEGDRLIKLGGDATVRDVIDVLNYINASPADVISLLQALKNAGALQGDLEVL